MAFVLEKISEEDMKRYGLEAKFKPTSRQDWAIDKERNVFLIMVGGGWTGESSYGKYELHYPNVGIVEFDSEASFSCKFNLLKMLLPFALEEKIELVKHDIQNGLDTFGYLPTHKKGEVEVKVNFPKDLKIHFKKGE